MNARSPKRFVNRMFGTGPWRTAPFSEIAAWRTDDLRAGVHHAESFAGIVAREEDSAFRYPRPTALLEQPETSEILPGGRRHLFHGLCPAPPKLLFTLTDAGIAGRDGVVYCPQLRTAAAETVRRWTGPAREHPLFDALRFPASRFLPGLSLSLATLDGEGYYHFLMESLPRLWLAREFLPFADHVLVSGNRREGLESWLEHAGVPKEKIRWLDGLAHFRCEQLLFANLPFRDCQSTPWVHASLRRLFHVGADKSPRRWLWISRTDTDKRHMAWEDALLTHFPKFEKTRLVELTPAAQIALFSEAAVVAGPHGGGLSNLVFSPPGLKLVEFFPDDRVQPLYARVAQVAGGQAAWAWLDFNHPADMTRLVPRLEAFLSP